MRIHHIALQFIGVLLLSVGSLITLHPFILPILLEPVSPLLDLTRPGTAVNSSEISADIVCRVAVSNSMGWHYETLESIAGLLPLEHVNLPSSCQSIVFDFHIIRGENEGHIWWTRYFESSMRGKEFSNLTNGDDSRRSIRRIIGNLTLHNKPTFSNHEYFII